MLYLMPITPRLPDAERRDFAHGQRRIELLTYRLVKKSCLAAILDLPDHIAKIVGKFVLLVLIFDDDAAFPVVDPNKLTDLSDVLVLVALQSGRFFTWQRRPSYAIEITPIVIGINNRAPGMIFDSRKPSNLVVSEADVPR